MGLPLDVIWFFSLTVFSILSLFSVLIVLIIICNGEVLFCSCQFGVLEAFYIWRDLSFSRFGKFSAIILLNILPVLLAYTSSPASMPEVPRLVFWWNHRVFAYSFWSFSVFCLSILLFSSLISVLFLFQSADLRDFLFPGFLVDFFFFETFRMFVKLFFYILYFHLYFIYLSLSLFYTFVCFIQSLLKAFLSSFSWVSSQVFYPCFLEIHWVIFVYPL
jgi:hypothetical protein